MRKNRELAKQEKMSAVKRTDGSSFCDVLDRAILGTALFIAVLNYVVNLLSSM